MTFRGPLKLQIVLLVGFIAYSSSSFTQATNGSEPQPAVEIPSPRHDAGTHWEGKVVTHAFEVNNTGNSELKILSVKPG